MLILQSDRTNDQAPMLTKHSSSVTLPLVPESQYQNIVPQLGGTTRSTSDLIPRDYRMASSGSGGGFLHEGNLFSNVCSTSQDTLNIVTNLFLKNLTLSDSNNAPRKSIEQSDFWVSLALATIGIFGVFGNVMNLAVLTRRRLTSTLDRLERSSNYGLFALAVSDLLICMVVIPHGFLMDTRLLVEEDKWFILYYKVYGVAFINLFMMISMWQVVSMAVHRYMIVVYPLQVRLMLSKKQTFMSIAIVYVFSMILTAPHFLHLKISSCHIYEEALNYEVRLLLSWGHYFQIYIRWIWPVLAVFFPAIILLVCNCRLVNDLHIAFKRQKKMVSHSSNSEGLLTRTRHSQHHSSNVIVTLTLVVVVLVAIFFVAPVEIVRYTNPYKLWGTRTGHHVALIGNLLQTVGFASNFILYFVVNSRFRQTLKDIICVSRYTSQTNMVARL